MSEKERDRKAERAKKQADGGQQRSKEQVLTDALAKIKSEQGKVCSEFEMCKHIACQSSYASWAIADKALRANN